jgi:RNA polymerase sigma factor (sigma-70 family)
MVLSVCRRVAGNVHDAEDAFQATFLVLVRKAASVVPRDLVGNWLYGVAYRTALAARGKTARQHARERQLADMPQRETQPEDVWQELQPVLDQELSRLPDKYRVPLVLCELDGRARMDVAAQLNLPPGTLSSRLATARKLLAGRLAGRSGDRSRSARGAAVREGGPGLRAGVAGGIHRQTAALLAAGEPLAGAISAKAAARRRVVKAMFLSKLKATAMVLLVLGAAVMGSVALVGPPRRHSGRATGSHRGQPRDAAGRRQNPPAEKPGEAEQQARPHRDGRAGTRGCRQEHHHRHRDQSSDGQDGQDVRHGQDIPVLRDGKEARLKDLKQGGRVTIRLAADEKTAVSISETGKTILATLKSVDPAKNTVTITVSGGRDPTRKDVVHTLEKDGKVTLAGKEAKFEDLKNVKPGSTVQLTFSADDEKKLVSIQYTARNR